MLGPSGFFLPVGNVEHDSNELELIHASAEGFNDLYRVCKNGRFFVYKALKPEFRGNPLYEDLLDKDFNIGFSLSHSNLCQYYAKIQHPAVGTCIVMEWIDGCTLEELIRNGQVDKKLAKKIICEICEALDYMHRKQIIHRDLKPENILVTHNGHYVKIIDFGLSDTDSYNTFKAPAGTRIYASPELVAGEAVDLRSDIWSLGVIMNEISSRYRHVAARCIRRDKMKRYGSASEVKRAVLGEVTRKGRMIIGVIALIGIIASVAVGLKRTYVSTETLAAPAEETVLTGDTPAASEKGTSENAVTESSSVNPAVEKPATAAAKDSNPADDKINAEELEELLNDAARSIL